MQIEIKKANADWVDVVLTLDQQTHPVQSVVIKRGDEVIGEITLGVLKDQTALMDEVIRARRLERVPRLLHSLRKDLLREPSWPDHINQTPKAKREAVVCGFFDGLALKTVPHPSGPDVPPMLPDQTFSYRQGYELGEMLSRATNVIVESAGGNDR